MELKALLILCGVLFVLLFIAVVLLRIANRRTDKIMQILKQTSDRLADSILQTEKLKAAIKAMSENRRKADEKIERIHSGDAVGNAIHELSKHKD